MSKDEKKLFGKMWRKKWFCYTLVGSLLFVLAVSIAYSYLLRMKQITYHSAEQMVQNGFNVNLLQQTYYPLENRWNFVLGAYSGYAEREDGLYCVLIDAETGEEVASSEQAIFLFQKDENGQMHTYMAQPEDLTEYMNIDTSLREEGEELYEIVGQEVHSAYVREDEFCVGEVEFIYYADRYSMETERTEPIDFSPEDVTGWEKIVRNEDETSGQTIVGPLVVGRDFTPEARARMDEWIAECWRKQANRYSYEESITEVMYSGFSPIRLSDGKLYYLYSYYYSNPLKEYGGYVVSAYVLLLLLLAGISFVMAKIIHTKEAATREKDEYRKRLVDSMAHDLKSPFMAISGYAENLKENINTEKKNYYADAIMENVAYMNRIMENVLELSRLEGKKITVCKKEISLLSLVKSRLDFYENTICEKKIKVSISGEMSVLADEAMMTRVMENLISNAVKYTPENGEIKIVLKEKKFVIQNTGGEVYGEKLKELVVPYVKGEESRKNKTGAGIGLAIVNELLEIQGFSWELKEEEGDFLVEITF